MTKIKLCGMRSEKDILACNAAGPDYVGFVFVKWSRRAVTADRAAKLRRLLSPGIIPVGVFANASAERVAALLNRDIIGAAQLHGKETAAYLKKLRALTDKPIIQAFQMHGEEDLSRAEKSAADHILLDAGAGGGKTFDWGLAKRCSRPFFLAGGLNAGNVAEAVEAVHPFGVDLSSGAETNGKKDPEKMRELVRLVHGPHDPEGSGNAVSGVIQMLDSIKGDPRMAAYFLTLPAQAQKLILDSGVEISSMGELMQIGEHFRPQEEAEP